MLISALGSFSYTGRNIGSFGISLYGFGRRSVKYQISIEPHFSVLREAKRDVVLAVWVYLTAGGTRRKRMLKTIRKNANVPQKQAKSLETVAFMVIRNHLQTIVDRL